MFKITSCTDLLMKQKDYNQTNIPRLILCFDVCIFLIFSQVPQLFIGTKYIGGEKELIRMHESGQLKKVFEETK